MAAVGIGIVGLGNVGGGALRLLWNNAFEIERKLGFPLVVTSVCSRGVVDKPSRDVVMHPAAYRTADWRELIARPDVDVVAELVGGTGVAREIVEAAIDAGKPVVTANKELLAAHGAELLNRRSDARLWLEASVAGGIPVIAALRDGIAGDGINRLTGILNGTSNYILTEVESTGAPFDDVLREAQALGYAEADPRADIDGYDARSKLAILTALAFGVQVAPSQIPVEGIRRILPIDFAYANRLGHTIRSLATASRDPEGLRLAVRPALVRKDTILAGVTGSYNALWVHGQGGDTFYYGKGAGPEPTGVAVVSDVMAAARALRDSGAQSAPTLGYVAMHRYEPVDSGSEIHQFYLRFRVRDRPGILASIAAALAEQGVSIEAVLQEPHFDKAQLPFVTTLEPTTKRALDAALTAMRGMDFLVDEPLALPLEPTLKSA